MKCFYHSDMDGHCAGAIVKKYYDFCQIDGEYLPINYNNKFPFDKIEKNEIVVIVDFSLQKEGDFEKLLEISKDIIWIDHHKTAIEKHNHLKDKIKGIRRNGISGCELTWSYFFQDSEMPRIVKMLGAYDIWDFSEYGNDLNKLQAGIRLYDTKPENPSWAEWLKTDDCGQGRLVEILQKGIIALQYRENYYSGLIKSWSWYTKFEGYRAIVCNQGSVSSQLFDSTDENTYDIMMPFVFDGKQWTVSIYTKKDIDCSGIAKKYGGGGHKQAAGFQCKELPFSKEPL